MDGLNLILIILIVVAFILVINHFFQNQTNVKPSHKKKSEIVDEYKKQMSDINDKYKNDEATLKNQKMIFLRNVSSQLHRNIFFDEDEVKIIIKNLANL